MAKQSAADLLRAHATVFEEKNKVYGENYKHFGRLMTGLYPQGLTVKTEAEWIQLGLILNAATCLQRYCFVAGGHADSAQDLSVYGAMMEEILQ